MTRQVLVDAALLERVLPAKWPGAEVCRICCVRLSPGEKHLSNCPIPAIQAALAAPQQPTPGLEAARVATIPPEIAAVVLAIGPAQWGVSVRQTDSEHGEMMTRSVRLTAEHFGQGDEPQPMQMLLREGTDTVIAYVGTSPHSSQAARGMTAAWNYLHRDCQALVAPADARGEP